MREAVRERCAACKCGAEGASLLDAELRQNARRVTCGSLGMQLTSAGYRGPFEGSRGSAHR